MTAPALSPLSGLGFDPTSGLWSPPPQINNSVSINAAAVADAGIIAQWAPTYGRIVAVELYASGPAKVLITHASSTIPVYAPNFVLGLGLSSGAPARPNFNPPLPQFADTMYLLNNSGATIDFYGTIYLGSSS